MKRHPSLQPLSREHHLALVCWRTIDQSLDHQDTNELDFPKIVPAKLDAAIQQLTAYWNSRFLPHMRTEEAVLLELLNESLRTKLLADHKTLRNLYGQIQESSLNARAFADEFREHIRWEERTVFPYLQEHLHEEQLAAIANLLNEHNASSSCRLPPSDWP